MVVHNFRTVDETGYMLLVMAEKRVGNPQKLKTDLAITIESLTLSWVEDEYCHKTGSESKWWARFSSQTALKPAVYVYLQMQWSCVCPLLGLYLWSSPSYRGSAGQPALSAHFVERNGAFCMDALSQSYSPLQEDHSSILESSSSFRNTHHSQTLRTHNLSRRGAVDRPETGTGEISHLLIENVK